MATQTRKAKEKELRILLHNPTATNIQQCYSEHLAIISWSIIHWFYHKIEHIYMPSSWFQIHTQHSKQCR